MVSNKHEDANPIVSIGLLSGLYYGSEGCREGFWRLAFDVLRKERVKFVAIVGGLVDFKSLSDQLALKWKGVKLAKREEVRKKFIDDLVKHLEENIPEIKDVKIYLITSPAYEGWIGEQIARALVERRKDFRLYRPGGDRLELKQLKAVLGLYAPKKGVWMRGDYYDTPALRVLKDEVKRSTRGIGDTNAVGCLASSVFHPGDSSDIKKPYMTLPVLYKITETRTAENQIGFRILKAASQNLKEATVTTYNLKDLASDEWDLVQTPPDSSEIQKAITEAIKKGGPMTVGQLADSTGKDRDAVQKALDSLVERRESKSWPKVYMDEASKRYYFNLKWFQEKLDYPAIECDTEDSIIGFGCLHAACKHTDMKFFRDEVPKLILANRVKVLVGAGDFIEGLKHDLMVKGEVYGSKKYAFNYTKQEKLSAYLVSQVMRTEFLERIGPFLKSAGRKKPTQAEVEAAVLDALLTFLYIPGNHCEWVSAVGFDALSVFSMQIRALVVEDVMVALAEVKLVLPNLVKLVNTKIVELSQNQPYTLSSGLSIALLHPYMSRTKTTSIRPQEMLQKADTHLVVGANFHVAEAVEQWEFGKGQRVCLQVGTIKRRSGFEDTKLKTVDFGVGLLKVCSLKNKIKRTDTAFYGTPTPNLVEANEAILDDFDKRLGF